MPDLARSSKYIRTSFNELKSDMKKRPLILCVSMGLTFHAYAQWERVSTSTISLSGEVVRGSLESYSKVAQSGYSKLILKSGGGYPRIALKIAEDIARRNVDVHIEGYCFSACANYLALAGRSLTVPCGSLLGWHGSPTGQSESEVRMQAKADGHPKELADLTWAWLEKFSREEKTFYARVGVDYRLLRDSVDIPAANALRPEVNFTFDEETGSASVHRSATMWIPTVAVLKRYRVPTEGFCPQYSEPDIRSVVKKLGLKMSFSSSGRISSD